MTQPGPATRYSAVAKEKSQGVTYTPRPLADFVATQIAAIVEAPSLQGVLRVMDPAVGDGELLVSLLTILNKLGSLRIEVYGFETDGEALNVAENRLRRLFPEVHLHLEKENFLEFVLARFPRGRQQTLFEGEAFEGYDLVIANPPYVRTQIMGAGAARLLAKQFGLSGRVDLYYAFIIGIAQVLKPRGVAGIIVSNRFMTTKSGSSVREAIQGEFTLRHLWDLGDTKLFGAAVLPAVLLVQGRDTNRSGLPTHTPFTSIYETTDPPTTFESDTLAAVRHEGVVEVADGRRFQVRQGSLNTPGANGPVWRMANDSTDAWLETAKRNTWATFKDIGRVRVGVKTCADKIFIRDDWQEICGDEQPELLRPLTSHHIARRFRAFDEERRHQILYPHEVLGGHRQPVELDRYPYSRRYLEANRKVLEAREYVLQASRQWFEIWVPQNPDDWNAPKLVCRDISEKPTFWIDRHGTVVNGDCYWLVSQPGVHPELLWLAVAVGNSKFIEAYYDHRFNNKLYAGRRRFITQYVEQFPLPDPSTSIGERIITVAQEIYSNVESSQAEDLAYELDELVWSAFGLSGEQVCR